jgi:hypothetical protein
MFHLDKYQDITNRFVCSREPRNGNDRQPFRSHKNSRGDAGPSRSPGPSRKQLRNGGFSGKSLSYRSSPNEQELKQLAVQHNRCFSCGFYVAPGGVEAHREKCQKNHAAFLRRMGQVAKALKTNPNVDVNAAWKEKVAK